MLDAVDVDVASLGTFTSFRMTNRFEDTLYSFRVFGVFRGDL